MKALLFCMVAFFVLWGQVAWGQVPEPAAPAQKPVLIIKGTAHIGNGKVIEKAMLVIENGVITQLGPEGSFRVDVARYEVIDAAGKHIYPGLILPAVRLGLEDISALRHTRDHSEVGDFNPNLRVITSYNTDSEIIPTLRRNGVLLAQIIPQSGILSGTSSVVLLDGWHWKDVAYKQDEGLHLYWPTKGEDPEAYQQKVKDIKKFFSDARTYAQQEAPSPRNLKLGAMRSLFKGEKKLYVHAYRYAQIIESLECLKHLDLLGQMVLVGAHDALHVATYLKEHNISVLLVEPHRLPLRTEEDLHLPYRLPYELHKRGILVGLSYSGTWSMASWRNLPFLAGTAAAYGLSKEEALQMITENTAKILGIDKRAGILEVGKDAHVLVSKGDLLDMRGNRITYAFVRGRAIALDGKQEMMYKRFMKKYKTERALQAVPAGRRPLPRPLSDEKKKPVSKKKKKGSQRPRKGQ